MSLLTLKEIISVWQEAKPEVSLTKYLSGKFIPVYDEETLKFKGFKSVEEE